MEKATITYRFERKPDNLSEDKYTPAQVAEDLPQQQAAEGEQPEKRQYLERFDLRLPLERIPLSKQSNTEETDAPTLAAASQPVTNDPASADNDKGQPPYVPVMTAKAPVFDAQPLNQFTTDFGAWNSPFDAATAAYEQDKPTTQPKSAKLHRQTAGKPAESAESASASEQGRHVQQDERKSQDLSDEDPILMDEAPSLSESDEALLRSAIQEVDVYKNQGGRDLYWKYGREEASGPTHSLARYLRLRRRTWIQALSTVSLAIMAGLVLGVLLLSLLNGKGEETARTDLIFPQQPANSLSDEDGAVAPATTAETETGAIDETAANSLSSGLAEESRQAVALAGQSYFVLQNGVFSSREGAEQALAALQAAGFAGVIEQRDDYYVYAALVTDRSDALAFSHHLQEQRFETFIKTLEIPAYNSLLTLGDAGQLQDYVLRSRELINMLSGLTAVHLSAGVATALNDSTVDAVQQLHQRWTVLSGEVQANYADTTAAAQLTQVGQSLNAAVLALGEYVKNPSLSYLWQVQQELMRAMVAQKELLVGLSAS